MLYVPQQYMYFSLFVEVVTAGLKINSFVCEPLCDYCEKFGRHIANLEANLFYI